MNFKERKPNRLKNYDYSQNGLYFVTICTKDRINYFGEIVNGEMKLNEFGKIGHDNLSAIPEHYGNIILDSFIVMPNHVHGIIGIFNKIVGNAYIHSTKNDFNGNAFMRSLQKNDDNRTKMVLPKIIQQYKASVTREIISNKTIRHLFFWQKSFHDHIIRNEKSLNNIRDISFTIR